MLREETKAVVAGPPAEPTAETPLWQRVLAAVSNGNPVHRPTLAKTFGCEDDREFGLAFTKARDAMTEERGRVLAPSARMGSGWYEVAVGIKVLNRASRFRRAAGRKLKRAQDQVGAIDPRDLKPEEVKRLHSAETRIAAERAVMSARSLRSNAVVAPASNLPPATPRRGS